MMDAAALSLYTLAAVSAGGVALTVLGLRSARAGRRITKTLVVLRCPSCGYTMKRQFREEDYVGKVDSARCPRCGERMVVDAIYVATFGGLVSVLRGKPKDREKDKNT